MSTVALLLRETTGRRGPGGANGLRVVVIACGQTAVARRGGLRDGRLQTSHRKKEGRERVTAQRKPADGPHLAQGVVVSEVRGATALFATEAPYMLPGVL
jgi:hypothetical protein